jgi:hypothetical protein
MVHMEAKSVPSRPQASQVKWIFFLRNGKNACWQSSVVAISVRVAHVMSMLKLQSLQR